MKMNAAEQPIVNYPTKNLDFDPDNPRFNIAYTITGHEDLDPSISRMIREENIQELMGSIGEQGYFAGEPLLICPSKKDEGRYIVVEGNRRLTAIKLLNGQFDHPKLPPSVLKFREEAKNKPTEVACILFAERKDILRYLGYRHITGAKRWDPLAKARYLAQLKDEFYKDESEPEQLKGLAKDIGSRSDYVGQMLTSLKIYEDAKEHKFYGLQHVREEDVDFSLLTTALSYKNISEFIGLKGRVDLNAQNLDTNNCRDLLSWCFAQNPESGDTVLVESRNLKKLAAIVDPEHPDALEELRRSHSISIAFQKTEAPSSAFFELINSAFASLRSAGDQLNFIDKVDEHHQESTEKVIRAAEQIQIAISQRLRRQRTMAILESPFDQMEASTKEVIKRNSEEA